MREPKSVLITGASSGIGAALAAAYAAPDRRLALGGRNAKRLQQVAAACETNGASVTTTVVDVTNEQAAAAWITETDADLVIANAGISAGTGGLGEGPDQARRIFDVNLTGVLNTVHPAIDVLLRRARPADGGPRGQVALLSSVAAFRGFAGAPAYCASKAAVRTYGEALRNAYAAATASTSM